MSKTRKATLQELDNGIGEPFVRVENDEVDEVEKRVSLIADEEVKVDEL